MWVGYLIGILVSIVVGVSLIPTIIDTIKRVEETGAEEAEPSILITILPIVFVFVIILGAVAWIGGVGIPRRVRPELDEDLIKKIFERSRKFGGTFQEVLGYLGFRDSKSYFPWDEPLRVNRKGEVVLRSRYGWGAVEKHPKFQMYLVVGFRKDKTDLCVYLLGRDSHTNSPYSMRLPPEYAENSIEEAIRWCMDAHPDDKITEV